jgi:hypothetical protein
LYCEKYIEARNEEEAGLKENIQGPKLEITHTHALHTMFFSFFRERWHNNTLFLLFVHFCCKKTQRRKVCKNFSFGFCFVFVELKAPVDANFAIVLS